MAQLNNTVITGSLVVTDKIINNSVISALSVNGTTITYTKGDGSTGDIAVPYALTGDLDNYLPYSGHNGGLIANPNGDTTWGERSGSHVVEWTSDDGACAFKFRKDCPSTGKMSMLIDGEVYANDGSKRLAHIDEVLSTSGGSVSGSITLTGGNFAPVEGKDTSLAAGTSKLYKNAFVLANPKTANDVGWIRITGTSESDTVLEIATGDDGGAGESIVFRGYNTANAVAYQVNVPKNTGTIALTSNFNYNNGILNINM